MAKRTAAERKRMSAAQKKRWAMIRSTKDNTQMPMRVPGDPPDQAIAEVLDSPPTSRVALICDPADVVKLHGGHVDAVLKLLADSGASEVRLKWADGGTILAAKATGMPGNK